MKQIKIKTKTNFTLPEYATLGAACFDIAASENVNWEIIEVDSEFGMAQAVVPTGLKFEIPEGYRMDIYPRSGWGFKYNIQLANGTGKIDSDYRGEVKVKLIAFGDVTNLPGITKGTRIAQGEINKVTQAIFKKTDNLSETERGQGGFGSTGEK